MMIVMNNDESTVTDIKHNTITKVSAVKNVSAIQRQQQDGNNTSTNTTNTAESLDKAVQQINKNEQIVQREMKFSIDEGSGKTVIKIMDLATDKVIRQIPNEEVLMFARRLNDGNDLKLFSEYI